MAILTLTKVWVNLLSTGAAVSAYSAPGRSQAHGSPGEVRTFAGGRQRSITKEGLAGKFGVTLLMVPAADRDTLRSWIGQAVQVRDHRGQIFYGTYYAVEYGEERDRVGYYTVKLELSMVTYAGAV